MLGDIHGNICNPLNLIIDLDDRDDAMRFLGIVAKQTARLDAIIDDLLLLSRIELNTDQDEISLIRIKLSEVLESALLTCQPKAQEKNIRIGLACNENLHVKINPNLMEQAVINLVSNAITYSPEQSEISVSATLHKQEGPARPSKDQCRGSWDRYRKRTS